MREVATDFDLGGDSKVGRRQFTESEAALTRAFVDKICASAEFSRSEQMARLLRFLVNRTLLGTGTAVNERTIALQVFAKRPEWDPREDTIVRTEARRLRAKLESYYQGLGRLDRVRISVPKGAYYAHLESSELSGPDDPTEYAVTKVTIPAVGSPSSHRFLFIGLVACIAIVSVLVTYRREYHVNTRQIGTFEVIPIANALGQQYSPAVSPDGKQIAYVWDGDGENLDIYIKSISGGDVHRLTNDLRADLYPAWSPDGRTIAYVRKGDLVTDVLIRTVDGGPVRTVTQIATETGRWAGDNSPLLGDPGPAWTHDGSRLIVADIASHAGGTGLYSVSIATGERIQLTAPPGVMHDFYPRVSPDGKTLAFVRFFTHGFAQIFTVPIDSTTGQLSGSPRQVTFDKQSIKGLTWDRQGSSLLFASNRMGSFELWAMDISSGDIYLIPTDTSSVADPSVSLHLNGIVFAQTRDNWNIWRAPIASGALGPAHRFLSSSGQNHDPTYSPGGSRIAFVSDRSGRPEIWVSSQDGSELRQVTNFNGVWIASPVWSPDGKLIAFDARPNGRACIYIVPSTGGVPKPLEVNSFENRGPAWSHDGRAIYFSSNRNGAVALWKKTFPDGGPAVQVAPKGSYLAQESVDGKELYYSDLQGNLFIASLLGGGFRPLPSTVHATPVVSWTIGNGGLYFTTSLPDGRSEVNRYLSNALTAVGQTSSPIVVNSKDLAVSPDGKFLLFSQRDSASSDIMIRRTVTAPLR